MGITQQIGASSLIKPGVIDNTAARPASPYEGQMVYQKDTDAVLVYNGTAWVETASAFTKAPRGVMGYVVSAAGNVTLTTTVADVTGLSLTFTAEANRVYRVNFNFTVQKDGTAGLGIFFVTDGANTINFEVIDSMVASEYIIVSGSYILDGLTAGSKTYKIRAFVTATQATLLRSADNKAVFSIEDIGAA